MKLEIPGGPTIPGEELDYETSRSSGPGGQHVNKVETRVTVRFDLAGSVALSDEQKERVRSRLAGRITREGVLRVAAQKHRSQSANRDEARARLASLLAEAIRPRRRRRKTRPSAASRRRRLENKRRRSDVKRLRRRPSSE